MEVVKINYTFLVWLLLTLTAWLAIVVSGKHDRVKWHLLVILGILGAAIRFSQFAIRELFRLAFGNSPVFLIFIGMVVTGLLVVVFLALPLLTQFGSKEERERMLLGGLYLFLGYFLFGVLQVALCTLGRWLCL